MKIRPNRQNSVGFQPLYLTFKLLRYGLAEMEHTAKICKIRFNPIILSSPGCKAKPSPSWCQWSVNWPISFLHLRFTDWMDRIHCNHFSISKLKLIARYDGLISTKCTFVVEYMSSQPVLSRVLWFSVLCFADHNASFVFSFRSFCFVHCIVCPSIYGFWLPLTRPQWVSEWVSEQLLSWKMSRTSHFLMRWLLWGNIDQCYFH